MSGRAAEATLVWDLPTRLFHWSLAAAVAASWWTSEYGDSETHASIGYCIVGLILFRLIWGVAGSETSRLAALAAPPAKVAAHCRHLLRERRLEHMAGHNPAGGYAVLLLLASVAVQAATGLFLYDDELFWGPLNHMVSETTAERLRAVHEWNFNFLLGLIALHIAAIVFYRVARGLNLVRPMVTGGPFSRPARRSPGSRQ